MNQSKYNSVVYLAYQHYVYYQLNALGQWCLRVSLDRPI